MALDAHATIVPGEGPASQGLCAALEWLARDFREHNEIRCRAFVPEEDDLHIDQNVATAAFRIVQESLTNVVRHSRATEVEILLVRGGFDIRSRPGSGTTVEARFPRARSDRPSGGGS